MKRFLCLIFLWTLLTFLLTSVDKPRAAIHAPVPVVASWQEPQHKSMHWIVTVGDNGQRGCTAYAIAPHVLLTAEHCMQSHEVLYIDQDKAKLQSPMVISEQLFDQNDHVLLVVNGTFTDTIKYDPKTYVGPSAGEPIYFWGNPAGVRDQYRIGYVTGVSHPSAAETGHVNLTGPVYMFSAPTIGGDSGSAIFDGRDGRLIGVVTYGLHEGLMGGFYELHFTPEQVSKAVR